MLLQLGFTCKTTLALYALVDNLRHQHRVPYRVFLVVVVLKLVSLSE